MAQVYAAVAQANRLRVITKLSVSTTTSSAIKSPAIFYIKGGSHQVRRWTDTEIAFRQESFFWYLTGVNEPDCGLIVDLKTQKSHLLIPRFDSDHVVWGGEPLNVETAKNTYGFDSVWYSDETAKLLQLLDPHTILTMEENVLQLRDEASVHAKYTDMIHSDLSLLRTAITECRMFKSEAEVEIMRKAAAITAKAHIALMKAVKSGSCVNEQQLHALFEYTCFFHGAKFQAYTPIVAKGKNGAVLHYVKNDESFIDNEKNDMILVDAGCELQLYASDVTRTFPISGTYSGDWKTTYEIVLDSQKAVLDAMKPGIQWEDMHRLAYRIICQGLQKVGILVGASTEELIANHIPALFFPHGLGHSLGIDVHDCGGYPAGVDRIQEPGIRYLRMRRELLPGMVVTVEPGVYFIDALLDPALNDPKVAKYLNAEVLARFRRNVGGVRIEDDILITETGIENLTAAIPKEIKDIETIMNSSN